MHISNLSFDQLPFSKLFKTYISDFDRLNDFFETDPFSEKAIADKVASLEFSGDRKQLADILMQFNSQFNIDDHARTNIERLKQDDALAIVTGQQLGVYGGPLYTFFKVVSVIHLSRVLENKFDRPVIPVFWLADEDHDYEEIRNIAVLDDDEPAEFSLPQEDGDLPPVGEMTIPEDIADLRKSLKSALYDTDFSDSLWDLLDNCFKREHTFRKAFGEFLSSLFSKHGLVLAGSNYQPVKKETSDILKKAVSSADEIRKKLEHQSEKIGNEFHRQVTLYDSNLFYLDEEKNTRTKISRTGDIWKTDTGREWKRKALMEEIDHHPERFSPNVFLRPILQDRLLPTLGYVAGPGETAYYGQMKGMYECFGLQMPVVFPRLSATFIEPAIERIMGELPFDTSEYEKRIEDLESEYVDRTEQHDIESIFDDWKEQAEQLSEAKKEMIGKIDPTLEGAVGNATSTYFHELDKLKGKVYRAVKKQDETQLKRIQRIQNNLFPGNGLQERVIAGIFYMNKYGIDIWDRLLESLDGEEFDHHKLIKL